MKIEKQLQDDHQMLLTVEVEADLMQASKRRAARQLAQRGKIPGFRPGKAPYDIVVRQYGEGAIIEQAMDLLVDEIYPKVLDQAGIKPAAPGSLEKIEAVDPPKLIFRVPLAPEVDLGDYRSLRAPYEWLAPGKKELDTILTELRQSYATTETVERAVELGDLVLADVKGALAKAKNGDDLSVTLSDNDFAVLVRKDDQDDEWPYPGFSKELIGLKPGESKTIKHKYPKDALNESLRGETVNFEVTVTTVRSMTLPDLDDDFAKMASQFETLEELKERIKKDLEAQSKDNYDNKYYLELIDKIREGATIKYPPQVLQGEIEAEIEDLRKALAKKNLDLDTYLKMEKTNLEAFIEEKVRPAVVKHLERSLILTKLADEEKITVDEPSLQNEFNQAISELEYQGLDLNQVSGGKQGQQQVVKAIAMEAANSLLMRRLLERIKSIATGEFKPEEAEGEKKPRMASADKKSGKSAGEKAEEEENAGETAPAESAVKRPKFPFKKAAKKAEGE